ncbi:sra-8, partial [Pristionchus pacificus]|uniref:G protein-coupled receptor n=1 Tax=Pristionchus pacificus TaxID=54126 RepID=A0A2A6BMS0_PRIPA
ELDCAYTEELYNLVPMHVLFWYYGLRKQFDSFQIVISTIAILLVVYIARYALKRTIFEQVSKELIIALSFFIVVYSGCLVIMLIVQLAYRYAASDKCETQVPKLWCIFRYIVTVTAFSFVIVHMGITAQHALSSFGFGRRLQMFVARLSIAVAFVYTIIFGVMSFYKESFEGRIAYCSGFTANSEKILIFNLYLVLIFDILNALASIMLWRHNKSRLRAEQFHDLILAFHRRQNLYAMRQFMPIATLHAVFYVVFFGTIYFSEQIKSRMSPAWYTFTAAISNVIPHYCFFCPLLFVLLIRQGRFERISHINSMIQSENNADEKYFGALRVQWN